MTPLFRIFIPNFRFFDRVGARPRVLVRRGDEAWTPLFTPPARAWWRVFFNPAGNLHHANQNLTERLLEEVQVAADVAQLASYRLVERLARASDATQFKLTAGGQDVLLSPELT